jgi:hypothetical protein
MATNRRRYRKTYKKPIKRRDGRMGYPSMGRKGRSKNPSNERNKRPKKSITSAFICATPYEQCSGSKNKKQELKFHATQEEVLICKGNYLIKQGFKKLNPREFINPETGRILVLTRKAGRAKPVRKNPIYLGKHLKVREW